MRYPGLYLYGAILLHKPNRRRYIDPLINYSVGDYLMEHVDITLKNVDVILLDQQLDTIYSALYQYGYNGDHEAAGEAMALIDCIREFIPDQDTE